MNVVDLLKGFFTGAGAAWVLWLLLGLAAVSLAISAERALFFRGRGGDLAALARALEAPLARQDVAGARALLAGGRMVAGAVASAGLRVAHFGPAAAEKAMAGAVALERERLETRLAFLGTLGNNAPFVGLFGTVIGVVQAFEQLGVTAPAGAGAGGGAGAAVSQAVMTGIAEALVATAVGIAVALPAVAAYNAFQRRIARLLAGTEAVTSVVLAYLLAEAPGAAALHALEVTGEAETAELKVEARAGGA